MVWWKRTMRAACFGVTPTRRRNSATRWRWLHPISSARRPMRAWPPVRHNSSQHQPARDRARPGGRRQLEEERFGDLEACNPTAGGSDPGEEPGDPGLADEISEVHGAPGQLRHRHAEQQMSTRGRQLEIDALDDTAWRRRRRLEGDAAHERSRQTGEGLPELQHERHRRARKSAEAVRGPRLFEADQVPGQATAHERASRALGASHPLSRRFERRPDRWIDVPDRCNVAIAVRLEHRRSAYVQGRRGGFREKVPPT